MTNKYYAFFWQQPEWIRNIIKWLFSAKTTWSVNVKRTSHGEWTFSVPPFFQEPFVGDTSLLIDWHYAYINGRIPVAGDTFKVSASTKQPVKYTSVMTFVPNSDENSQNWSTYREDMTDFKCPFCPVFPIMFGGFPEKLFLNFSN